MKVVPIVGIAVMFSMYIALLWDVILIAIPHPAVEMSERMGYLRLIPF
jgi:hypothetical protein